MKYKYSLKQSPRFDRELEIARRRGLKTKDLDAVVKKLRNDEQLDRKYNDHPLHGQYKGFRECHINPDWLLIYMKDKEELILHLAHTGTHSDLFR